MVEIERIDPSPFQPRTRFKEEALEELAQSIRASGIIQPLVLRAIGVRFQLIAGERRWRAAQRAGMLEVPAVLRDVTEEQALELTLVENIQREDLNPVEQARAFSRLAEDFGLTQEEIASRTGKDRTTITNSIRLLKLEAAILEFLEDGKLTAGHARALLSIQDSAQRTSLAVRAASGLLTVRQLEKMSARRPRKNTISFEPRLDPNARAALDDLQRALGTKVSLRPKSAKRPGQLIIEFYDDEQLAGLYDRLVKH